MWKEFLGGDWHKVETEKLILILDAFSIENKKDQEKKRISKIKIKDPDHLNRKIEFKNY